MTTSAFSLCASATPRLAMSVTLVLPSGTVTGTLLSRPSFSSCCTAAGRCKSAATSSGRCPSRRTASASFAAVVVLPLPCSPMSITTVGGCGWYCSFRVSPPSSAVSSSSTIFTICWPGVSDSRTSLPTARSRIRSTKARATLKFTSASSSATRTSRSPASTSSLLSRPRPLKRRSAAESLSLRESNTSGHRHAGATQLITQAFLEGVATLQLRRVSQAVFKVLQLGEPAPHQVVGATARAAKLLCELGERPVLVEMQTAGFPLVRGQQRAVHVEKPLVCQPAGEPWCLRSVCQGQDLDILPEHSPSPASAGATSLLLQP